LYTRIANIYKHTYITHHGCEITPAPSKRARCLWNKEQRTATEQRHFPLNLNHCASKQVHAERKLTTIMQPYAGCFPLLSSDPYFRSFLPLRYSSNSALNSLPAVFANTPGESYSSTLPWSSTRTLSYHVIVSMR